MIYIVHYRIVNPENPRWECNFTEADTIAQEDQPTPERRMGLARPHNPEQQRIAIELAKGLMNEAAQRLPNRLYWFELGYAPQTYEMHMAKLLQRIRKIHPPADSPFMGKGIDDFMRKARQLFPPRVPELEDLAEDFILDQMAQGRYTQQ